MTGKLVIKLEPLKPATLNKYIEQERKHRILASKLKKQTEAQIAIDIRQAMVDGVAFQWPVNGLTFVWYLPNMRIDPDNWAFTRKFIFDAMRRTTVRGQAFMPGDTIKHVDRWQDIFKIDRENPRLEIVEMEE